jgi:hypothetical protein
MQHNELADALKTINIQHSPPTQSYDENQNQNDIPDTEQKEKKKKKKKKGGAFKTNIDGPIPMDLYHTRFFPEEKVVAAFDQLTNEFNIPPGLHTLEAELICRASNVVMERFGKDDPALALSLSVRLMRRTDGTLPVRVPDCFNVNLRTIVYKHASAVVRERKRYFGRIVNSADSGKLYQVLNSLKDSRNIFYMASKDPRKPCEWRLGVPDLPQRFERLFHLLYGSGNAGEWEKTVVLYDLPRAASGPEQLKTLLMPGHRLMQYIRAETGIFGNDKEAIAAVRGKEGGDHVGKHGLSPPDTEIFLGPVAGAPVGALPVRKHQQAQHMYAYAKSAPFPDALRLAVRVLFCSSVPDNLHVYRIKQRNGGRIKHKLSKELS